MNTVACISQVWLLYLFVRRMNLFSPFCSVLSSSAVSVSHNAGTAGTCCTAAAHARLNISLQRRRPDFRHTKLFVVCGVRRMFQFPNSYTFFVLLPTSSQWSRSLLCAPTMVSISCSIINMVPIFSSFSFIDALALIHCAGGVSIHTPRVMD